MGRAHTRQAIVLASTLCLIGLTGIAAEDGPGSPILFREVAEEWGVDFRHHHGGSGSYYLVETMIGGLISWDYDLDGDEDLFFVDGGALPGYEGEAPRSRLFRNDGPGHFTDVTDASGIVLSTYGSGAVSGDYDGDGDPDLYVTAFGSNQLFRNLGDGSFEDVTEAAGVGEKRWSTSATFADFDRDGDLDLYTVNYVDFTIENHKTCGDVEAGFQGYCIPSAYEPTPDRYYENLGDGTFQDATEKAGLIREPGRGLGIIAGDLTNDGWPDLYVTNDITPNFLFINQGDGTFEDATLISGAAFSDRGLTEAGMGVDLADLDGNGFADIVATNFELETNALYRNMGDGLFLEGRFTSGLAEPSFLMLCFGVLFADLDHDADQDLAIVCGSVNDSPEAMNAQTPFKQPQMVFENTGGGRFKKLENHGMDVVRSSRGSAFADFDHDGDLDLAVLNSIDLAEVYENLLSGPDKNWLMVDLASESGNARAIGARVEATWKGETSWREVHTASSYQSQSALSLHFGVGAAKIVDSLVLRWPDGQVQELMGLPSARRYQVVR